MARIYSSRYNDTNRSEGYVEDKYSLEKLSGALAICEVWDTTENKWIFWDAEICSGQVNPQLTDENGRVWLDGSR